MPALKSSHTPAPPSPKLHAQARSRRALSSALPFSQRPTTCSIAVSSCWGAGSQLCPVRRIRTRDGSGQRCFWTVIDRRTRAVRTTCCVPKLWPVPRFWADTCSPCAVCSRPRRISSASDQWLRAPPSLSGVIVALVRYRALQGSSFLRRLIGAAQAPDLARASRFSSADARSCSPRSRAICTFTCSRCHGRCQRQSRSFRRVIDGMT